MHMIAPMSRSALAGSSRADASSYPTCDSKLFGHVALFTSKASFCVYRCQSNISWYGTSIDGDAWSRWKGMASFREL